MERVAKSQYPAMVCGNFNDVISSETYEIISATMMDAQQTAAVLDTGVTFHNYFKIGDNSGTPIDFLFFSKDLFEINKFEICRDRRIDNNGALSDHYPIKVTLKFYYEYEDFYPDATPDGFDGPLHT